MYFILNSTLYNENFIKKLFLTLNSKNENININKYKDNPVTKGFIYAPLFFYLKKKETRNSAMTARNIQQLGEIKDQEIRCDV